MLRSADFEFRHRVEVKENGNYLDAAPYVLTFSNYGDKPVELQHGKAGYTWIEPAESLSHTTHAGHIFDLGENTKAWSGAEKRVSIASVRIEEAKAEL